MVKVLSQVRTRKQVRRFGTGENKLLPMTESFQLLIMLNRLRILSFKRAFPFPQSRSYAKSGPPSAIPGDGEYKDFRPPWVYLATHILTYTLIPCELFISVYSLEQNG
jgi:hypothetical protein